MSGLAPAVTTARHETHEAVTLRQVWSNPLGMIVAVGVAGIAAKERRGRCQARGCNRRRAIPRRQRGTLYRATKRRTTREERICTSTSNA